MGSETIKQIIQMAKKANKVLEIRNIISDLKELSNDPTYQNALKLLKDKCQDTYYLPKCKEAIEEFENKLKEIEERVKIYNDKSNCEGITATECIYDKVKRNQDEKDQKNNKKPLEINFEGNNDKATQTNQEKLANLSLDELRQKHLEQMKNLYVQEEISNKL